MKADMNVIMVAQMLSPVSSLRFIQSFTSTLILVIKVKLKLLTKDFSLLSCWI
jgi:hypothetical protein